MPSSIPSSSSLPSPGREIDAGLQEIVSAYFPSGATLAVLPSNAQRRDHTRQRAYLVTHNREKIGHLTAGPDLGSLWTRTQAFHKACADITANPLFFKTVGTCDYLGREFISGRSIADLMLSGELAPEKAQTCVTKIQEVLARTRAPSDRASAETEAAHVFREIQQLPHLSAVDKTIFDTLLAPMVYAGIGSASPSTRWTNGDFTARNLIISSGGDARLIDYEFAHQTHFAAEDIWRWLNFSQLPSGEPTIPPDLASPSQPWLEIFLWAKQLVLSHATVSPQIAETDSAHALAQIARLASTAGIPLGSGFSAHLPRARSESELEIARLKIERDELSDKLLRMQNSRSWKISAPLRAVRRWLSS